MVFMVVTPAYSRNNQAMSVITTIASSEPGIFFENKSLVQFLKDWQAMKELLQSGSQTQDNYEIWKTIRPSVTKVTHEE